MIFVNLVIRYIRLYVMGLQFAIKWLERIQVPSHAQPTNLA